MNLGAPQFIIYFLAPLALFYLVKQSSKSKESIRRSLFDEEARKLFFGKVSQGGAYVFCLSFVFFGLAVVRPQFGYQEIIEERVGQDIAFVVDVSKSMLAKDLSPNRLGRVRFAIIDLLSHLKGDRIGLISFAGVSFIESPLTYDYSTFRLFLDDLSPDLIPVPGSNIESALKRVIQLFGGKDKKFILGRGKTVILFSDGEEQSGNLESVVTELKELGIKVYTVGIGSEIGAPIPTEKGYKRDKTGKVILSKLNRQGLEKLAAETGGAYLGGELTGAELEKFFVDKVSGQKERSKIAGGVVRVWKEYYQIALLLGLICYLVSAVTRRSVLASLFIFLLISPSSVRADTLEEAYLNYAEGNFRKSLDLYDSARTGKAPYLAELGSAKSLYKLKRFSEAKQRYLELTEKEKKPEFLYNLGNTQTQLGEYEQAIKSYEETLLLSPNDKEAKENLEYVKKLLKDESNNSSSSSSSSSQNSSNQSSTSNGGGGGQSSNQSSQSNQNSDKSSSNSDQNSSSNSSSSSASGGRSNASSSDDSSNNSSSSKDGKSGSESSSSQSSAGNDGQGSSQSSASSAESSQQSLPSDREEMLYDSVQEDRGALRKYREQKALEELEENQESPPEKDW